jgi:hypothetical protein
MVGANLSEGCLRSLKKPESRDGFFPVSGESRLLPKMTHLLRLITLAICVMSLPDVSELRSIKDFAWQTSLSAPLTHNAYLSRWQTFQVQSSWWVGRGIQAVIRLCTFRRSAVTWACLIAAKAALRAEAPDNGHSRGKYSPPGQHWNGQSGCAFLCRPPAGHKA